MNPWIYNLCSLAGGLLCWFLPQTGINGHWLFAVGWVLGMCLTTCNWSKHMRKAGL